MFSFGEYLDCYGASVKVVSLYDSLTDVLVDNNSSIKEFNLFFNELKKAIYEENILYSKLSIDDIREYGDKIKKITDEEGILFSDIRISSRLAFYNDKLIDYTIRNNGLFPTLDDDLELSLNDIVNSKINIDIYKLINSKISNLSFSDEKSLKITRKIDILNIEHIIYKLSIFLLSEKLGIDSMFNINKIPVINLDIIEDRLEDENGMGINLYEIINSKIYDNVINLINSFKNMSLNSNDYKSIYDNLIFVSQFEVLLPYLTREQLMDISLRMDEIKSDNKVVLGNIKRFVRSKINEF